MHHRHGLEATGVFGCELVPDCQWHMWWLCIGSLSPKHQHLFYAGCSGLGSRVFMQCPPPCGFCINTHQVRTKADSPIRLISAGSYSLKRGTHCIHGAVLLSVAHKGEYAKARNPEAALYIADIGPRAILGYPLLVRYALAVFPGQGSLILKRISAVTPSLSRPLSPHAGWN